MKGSIEGLEQAHGAAIAMNLSSDCRVLQQIQISEQQTPMQMSGSSTMRFMGQQQAPKIEATEVTTTLKDKLGYGLTKQFQYCGRPGLQKYSQKFL